MFLNYKDGTDEQMVFQGKEAFNEAEVFGEDDGMVDIDEGLQEIFAQPEVEEIDDHIEQMAEKHKFMTPARLRQLTAAERDEYLFGGLD